MLPPSSGFYRSGERAVLVALLAASIVSAATLSGTVLEDATGRPVARARVSLQVRRSAGGDRNPASVLTGSAGEFSFGGRPAGIYFLRAEKKGYAKLQFGQRRYGLPGTPIVLTEEAHFAAELRLKRLGVVTGRLLDENQIGLPGLTVYAYKAGKRIQMVKAAESDDRGVYRLAGLKPGRYLVRTAATQLAGRYGLLPTYYGQTASARGARVVEVQLDQEVTGADITPLPGHLAVLAGTVVGAAATEVILVTDTGPRKAPVRPGGRFRFGQVEPGGYTLLVEPSATRGKLAAYRKIFVGDTDVDVALEMKHAPKLTIQCVTVRSRPIGGKAVSIFLRRKQFGETSGRLGCGQTVLWSPGTWQIGVAPPPRYFVDSLLGTTLAEEAAEFVIKPAEEKTITVLLGVEPATLSGKVRTSDGTPAIGAPVYLNAEDAETRVRTGGVRRTRTDQEGSYRFVGLPPGRYETLSSYQMEDAVREGWAPGLGTSVTVEKGEKATQDLVLMRIQ